MIGKHLRDIWEASGRHLGSKGAPRRHPGGTQETPRRHPGGTQEAARRHPGAPRAPRSLQEVLGAKKSTPLSLNAKKSKKRRFHEVFLMVWVTKYRAWRQNLSGTLAPETGYHQGLSIKTARTLTDEICLGNYYTIRLLDYYIIIFLYHYSPNRFHL